MCELTFSDLGKLNKPYFIQQAITNALSNNNDGIGWMQKGQVWKSKLSGARVSNLGSLARKGLANDAPLAFHVRYATNKLLNEDCHSHPYPGDKLILMHNGKLDRKDSTLIPTGKVDSQVFLEELEAEIVTSPDIPIVDLFQSVMDRWCGKFAFMVYDLRDSNYYIMRGNTADLYWSTVDDKLVVNTVKLDLDKATHVLNQMTQLTQDEELDLGEIKPLDTNTIYKFIPKDSSLEKVGELKENRAPLVASAWGSRFPATASTMIGIAATTAQSSVTPIYKKISNWLDFHGMSLVELNLVSLVIMGTSLLELDEDDIGVLNLEVLRKLTEQASTSELDDWKAIQKLGYGSWAYSQPEFEFPWMLNDSLDLSEMREAAEYEYDQRKKEREARNKTS